MRYFLPILILALSGCVQNSVEEVELVAYQLRGLVKELEFHKLVAGKYPASLSDVNQEVETISIEDLFLKSNGLSCDLTYNRLNHGYILLSVGPDRKPLTTDDVVPLLTDVEKNAVGWIDHLNGKDMKDIIIPDRGCAN